MRVALVYGAVAWLLVQIIDVVSPALPMLPDWTLTLAVVLVLIGFPLAVVLAWAFDLTPSGVERTRSLSEARAPESASASAGIVWPNADELLPAPVRPVTGGPDNGWFDAAAHGRGSSVHRGAPVVATAVIEPERSPGSIRSIAALPLVNLGRDDETEYFTDGMTEELINALTRIPGLRVAARTSSFAFKARALDVREIARALGVQGVVEGSVRMMGNRIRVSVKLVDAVEGHHVWSNSYDREIDDVFAIQDEIASSIVDALELELRADGQRLAAPPTRDVESYRLYLKGRFFWNRRTPDDLMRSADAFREVITRDPGSALAHAGLADAYTILLDYGIVSPGEALPRARQAAERAVQLDDGLAETHTSVALVRQFEWDWRGAEASFRRALERNPGYATARHRYALCLAWMGRHTEAIREMSRAAELDPLSLIIGSSLAMVHYYARRYDEAAEQARQVLDMDERFPMAHLARALARSRQPEQAVADLEAALEHAGGESPSLIALLAYACGRGGQQARARDLERRLEHTAQTKYVSGYYRSLPSLGLGNHEAALSRLDQACEERAAHMVYLGADPILDPLRTDPRFTRLLEAVGLARPVA